MPSQLGPRQQGQSIDCACDEHVKTADAKTTIVATRASKRSIKVMTSRMTNESPKRPP